MRGKLLLIAAVLFVSAAMAQAQPNVPILEVDTLCYLGKTEIGEAKGAFFLPDGNIIAIWKDTPIIIDSKTGEILRELEKSPVESVIEPELSNDGTKLVASRMGPRFEIWDIPSGKVVKQSDFIIRHFCLSPDGTKLYVTKLNEVSNPGVISVIDMVTMKETERFFDLGLYAGSYIDISPDGETLALSAFKEPNNEYDTKTNQVILIDLKSKTTLATLETFDPQVNSMEFSPDGKQITLQHSGGTAEDSYIYIYNLVTKEKKYIRKPELSTLFGFKVAGMGHPRFIESNIIQFEIGNESDEQHYLFTWNILENKIKNYINLLYNLSIDIKDSTILVCSDFGVIGYLNKNIVPVKENKIETDYLSYRNNNLEYYSDKSFLGQMIIYDTTGKEISNLGSHYFVVGQNIIRVNQLLPTGTYILTIINGTEQISKKFIVE